MKRNPSFVRVLTAVLAVLLGLSGPAWAGPPEAGGQVPADLSLTAPVGPSGGEYLGIGQAKTFKLSDVKSPYILLEVVGVYCPQCHVQAPLFDKFFQRLSQDKELSAKVKMLGMAAGATKEEMDYLRESGVYKYPVASDPDFAAHKRIGEPKTPYTMLLDAKGKVLFAHLGIIEDVNAFYEQVAKLAR
ncbi:MAG: redoxin family protein [Thermodesulfobacteriota bacterium]